MNDLLTPDPDNPGAFTVMLGPTAQSYVDPADPLRLEFDYVQRICEVLDATVLRRDGAQRVRVIHLGGGGLTIPRWVEARRPRTAQIVCEPDADLIEEVRRKLPLGKHSGIKIRPVTGREGLAAMPQAYADAIVLDAFAEARVPGDLATRQFCELAASRLRPGGVLVANIADQAPFHWAKRFTAGVASVSREVIVAAEPAVWKGRRYGNLVVAGGMRLPATELAEVAHRATFSHKLIHSRDVTRWLGGAVAWDDAEDATSPGPPGGASWFS